MGIVGPRLQQAYLDALIIIVEDDQNWCFCTVPLNRGAYCKVGSLWIQITEDSSESSNSYSGVSSDLLVLRINQQTFSITNGAKVLIN
ncbi:hypothetical protein KSP39_PZI013264 [Platanthera zijinensis]|uniref:Uncharacterized protein n=1 Tax=Platanthera zijinensis TaxID=2320716 RepID=A0AAP0BCG8_9ASPA